METKPSATEGGSVRLIYDVAVSRVWNCQEIDQTWSPLSQDSSLSLQELNVLSVSWRPKNGKGRQCPPRVPLSEDGSAALCKSDDLSFHSIFIILLKNCVCCLCVSLCIWGQCFQRPEESTRCPRSKVTGHCKLRSVGAGDQTCSSGRAGHAVIKCLVILSAPFKYS